MKQFLHYFKIALSLLMLLQMGELSAQTNFVAKPATFVSADKSPRSTSFGQMSAILDGEGKTGTIGPGLYANYFLWEQPESPVTFFINMNASSTISGILFYKPWIPGEAVKNVTVRLYEGTTLRLTQNIVLPNGYSDRYQVSFGQKLSNITKVEFVAVDDYGLSENTPKRISLQEIVLGYDCGVYANTIETGVSKYLCNTKAITPITLATTNATAATVTGLPPGLTGSWSANVFTISGTPTTVGTYTYTVTATDGNCSPATATGKLTVGGTPTLSKTALENTCTSKTVNLNDLVTSTTPEGASLVWFSSLTPPLVTDPTAVPADNYYAFYTNADKSCYGLASAVVTVTIKNCCATTAPPSFN